MSWLKDLLEALGIALGLITQVRKEVEEPKPDLMDPPPPPDKGALVHDLEEIRKRRFGK